MNPFNLDGDDTDIDCNSEEPQRKRTSSSSFKIQALSLDASISEQSDLAKRPANSKKIRLIKDFMEAELKSFSLDS